LEPVEFVGDVFCGARTAAVASPVEVPGPHTGDPMLADLAFRVRGYWGDTTRTTVVGEHAEASEAVEAIAAILAETGDALGSGVRVEDVYRVTDEGGTRIGERR